MITATEVSASISRPVASRIRSDAGFFRRRFTNVAMLSLTGLLTVVALIPLVWIIAYVIYQGSQYITPAFFTQLPTPVGVPGGGVLHSIQGTLIITLLASLFGIPPGVLAAFYAAYRPNTPLGVAVRFGTDVLAGVPSIVIGLFCYGLIVKPMGNYSALAGGIAIAMLMLPIIIRTTEEMIKLVPSNLREASLALGAPEWKTSLTVVLPAAANGVITGILLGIARASGETAPLLFTALGNDRFDVRQIIGGGLARGHNLPGVLWNVIDQPVDSLPLTLFKYASQPAPERVQQAWATALVLMGLVLLINIISRVWILYRNARMRG